MDVDVDGDFDATDLTDEVRERIIQRLVNKGTNHALRWDEDENTRDLEEFAYTLVTLREMFEYQSSEGSVPDYRGLTGEYRAAVGRIYDNLRLANMDVKRIRRSVPYHVGNIVRERATEHELEALGLTEVTPRDRARNYQRVKLTSLERLAVHGDDYDESAAVALMAALSEAERRGDVEITADRRVLADALVNVVLFSLSSKHSG